MITERLNEARNRPWADVEAIDRAGGSGESMRDLRRPPTGRRPGPRSARARRPVRWAAMAATLVTGSILLAAILAWARSRGWVEVTVEHEPAC